MHIIRPTLYPHWGTYAYTERGFDRRVVPRLLALGVTRRDVQRLRSLYFQDSPSVHQNAMGAFCNKRHFRLYYLSRSEGFDRKAPLLNLIVRSGLFYVCWEGEAVRWILSPYTCARLGSGLLVL